MLLHGVFFLLSRSPLWFIRIDADPVSRSSPEDLLILTRVRRRWRPAASGWDQVEIRLEINVAPL